MQSLYHMDFLMSAKLSFPYTGYQLQDLMLVVLFSAGILLTQQH